MSKSRPSAGRSITGCAVLVVVSCFVGCSTKSRLVGSWSTDPPGSPFSPWTEAWSFRSDNTCSVGRGTRDGTCKYTVLDDGSIKIEIEGGATVTAKLENNKLMINWGERQSVLYKSR